MKPEIKKPSQIAVIGAGIAGMVAAHLLDREHEVTLFEKNDYVGGHTNTVVIDRGPDEGTAVDTGFIVFNDRNYPNFIRFLSGLGIKGQDSDMSFSYSSPGGSTEYSSYFPNGLFAQRRNLLRPSFYQMVFDILRFNKQASADLHSDRLGEQTLGGYLEKGRYSSSFMNHYLLPMGAAIWSTPLKEMLQYPAASFMRFFDNHGLLALKGRPHWMSIPGGSHSYIKALLKRFRGTVKKNGGVREIRRMPEAVQIKGTDGSENSFDYAVIAVHADQALAMLADPSQEEKRLLGAWTYNHNHTVLHTDMSAMPKNRRAWASWNYMAQPGTDADSPVSLTYHMNRLQALKTKAQYFVTLNRVQPVAEKHVIREIKYTHPVYTRASYATQARLPGLNGVRRTFFCGSYFGYGFHEDAVKSSLQTTEHFGLRL